VDTPKASASINAGSEGPLSDNGASGERDDSILRRRKLERLFKAIKCSYEILVEPKFNLDSQECDRDLDVNVALSRDE